MTGKVVSKNIGSASFAKRLKSKLN